MRLRCLVCGCWVRALPHKNSHSIKRAWGVQDAEGMLVQPCKHCLRAERVAIYRKLRRFMRDLLKKRV